ncbi:MAG: protein kinase domain-containing protein [Persicimonas sp.]
MSSGDTSCANCGAQLERDTSKLERSADDLRRMTQSMRAVDADRIFPPGEVLADRFELRALVGRGPFGEVYRAEDSVIEAEVAVKVFAPEITEDPRHQERFVEATRAARSMTQTNVVRVHQSGVHRDHGWVSMQMLEGLSLSKLIEMREKKDEGFDLEEVEPIVSQVTLALQHINREYPHGDLQPTNVMMLPELVKVTDHYVFSAVDTDLFAERRADSPYVAPEVLAGRETIDVRSDVYSLGMIVGRMIFGPGYSAGDAYQGEAKLERVAQLCERATAADPDQRYGTVEALSEDFATLVDTGALLDDTQEPDAQVPAPPEETLEEVSAPPPAPTTPASSPSIEDEIATREYDRDEAQQAGPDVAELLETREMDRDDYPSGATPPDGGSPEAPAEESPPVEPTAVARRDRPETRRTRGDDSGSSRGLMAVAAVALLAMFGGFLWIADQQNESEPVEIGGEDDGQRKESSSEEDDEEDRDEKKKKKRFVKAADRATGELLTARGKALTALEEAEESESSEEGDDEDEAEEADDEEASESEEAEEEKEGARADKSGSSDEEEASGQGSASRDEGGEAASDGTECKGGMVLVRDDGGNYCIDAYEYPGRGSVPDTNVTWFDAEKACKSKGKRLCKLTEWRRGCGASYPYGDQFDASKCNTVDEDDFERDLAPAGSFDECQSWTGAYDMSGNVHEWVDEQKIAGGGFDSGGEMAACGYASNKDPGSSAPNIGFRCCADAE